MTLPKPHSRLIELSKFYTGLTAEQIPELLKQHKLSCDSVEYDTFEVTLQPYTENDDIMWNATVFYSKAKMTNSE